MLSTPLTPLATDHIPMVKTTTTPVAAHNGRGVFQATNTDPQQQKQYHAQHTKTQPQSYFSSSHSSLALRSDIMFDSATATDLDTSTALTRPANSNYNAITNATKKKRTPIRRTSPSRTRSMTRANRSLVQDLPSTSASPSPSSLSSQSPSSLVKPVATMTAPERTRKLVSTRAITTRSSVSSAPTAASPTTAPTSQDIGCVRQAVNRLEEKILLNHQAQRLFPSLSSRALILGGKRRRSHDRDETNQSSKSPRTQSHQGLSKRHTHSAAPEVANVRTFSFRFPAGLDPSFPLGFVGQFIAPSPQAASPAGSRPLDHSSPSRACSSTSGVASSANATGQIIEQDTTADAIKGFVDTLLCHLPTAHHTPLPPRPPIVESLMSDPSTQNLRRVPLTTRSGSNTTDLSLPAITFLLPTEGPRPSRNGSTRTQSNPERVRLSLTYHLERQDSSNQHAVPDAIDLEPVSPLDERSLSVPASSTTPRRATHTHQPRK